MALLLRIEIRLLLRKIEEAAEDVKGAERIDPQDGEVLLSSAQVAVANNRIDEHFNGVAVRRIRIASASPSQPAVPRPLRSGRFESNLVLETICSVEDSFDRGIDDLAAVHADTDFIADFKLPWGGVGLFRRGKIVRHIEAPY
jgi:hypothetical protein